MISRLLVYLSVLSASAYAIGSVTNATLATMANHTIKCRNTSGTGQPEDCTATQVTAFLNAMVGDSGSGGTKGLVPAAGAGDAAAGKFLNAAGGFSVPSGSGGGCVAPVLTKTTDYTVSTSDFTCANKEIMVEMNCSSSCVLTFPAASNSGFKIAAINIGTATVTETLAGSDTYGSTADQTWIMPAGGSPQMSSVFRANGGSRWNGF